MDPRVLRAEQDVLQRDHQARPEAPAALGAPARGACRAAEALTLRSAPLLCACASPQYARGVCSLTLALDEVDHLLRSWPASSLDGLPVVSPGELAAAHHGGVPVPALLQRECVVVVHACAHYVAFRVCGASRSARVHDGLNAAGDPARRTVAASTAVGLLSAAMQRTLGAPLAAVVDARCAQQCDPVTCGLHAARNAALLRAGLDPGSDVVLDSASVAADMDGLARVVELRRRDACPCAACRGTRATRRWAALLTALAARLAVPRPQDPLLLAALASPGALDEDADADLPLWLPLPCPPSELKAMLATRVRTWAAEKRGFADADAQPAQPLSFATAAAAGALTDAEADAWPDDDDDGGPTLTLDSDAEGFEASASDGDDASEHDWQQPTKRRRMGRGSGAPHGMSGATRNPLRVTRGRYGVLAAARSKASAADKQLASARVAAEEARMQASMAAAAAVAHDSGAPACDEAPATPAAVEAPPQQPTTATPTAGFPGFKRPLTCTPFHTPTHDPRPVKRPALSTPSFAFRRGTTLRESLRARDDARARKNADAIAAAVAAARRATFNAQLHERARALAEAAAEAERAVQDAERRAAEAAAELRDVESEAAWTRQARERRGAHYHAEPSGRRAAYLHMAARCTPFRESAVKLSARAALCRAGNAAAADLPHITDQHRLDVGRMLHTCRHCKARFWDGEKLSDSTPEHAQYTTCCKNGDVALPPRQPFPEPLMRLVKGDTPESVRFLEKFRTYQSAFQAASTGLENKTLSGPHSAFVVQGRLYHRIATSATPESNEPHRFLQIYTLDDQAAAARRGQLFEGLDSTVLLDLTRMLEEHNPYARQFKALGNASTPTATLILQTPCNEARTVNGNDARTYRLPTASEVAILVLGDDDEPRRGREVIVHKVQGQHAHGYAVQRIPTNHQAFMPLHFMLMCPRGETGWHEEMYRVSGALDTVEPAENVAGRRRRKRTKISALDWGAFYMAVRGDKTAEENPLHCCKRGFGEWCCESYALVEEERLRFYRSDAFQNQLRRTSFDHIVRSDAQLGAQIGQRVILPASYMGSPRNMYLRYADAMALVRRYGKPSFFITFTCNAQWPEILRELRPGEKPEDRSDLTARVFNLKLNELLEDLTKHHVLGRVIASTYVIEYQKRGLPHAHILLIVHPDDVPKTPADVDACVSAEIPDAAAHPNTHATVTSNMMHGPCGVLDPTCACMQDNACSRKFPRPFVEETTFGENGAVTLRRRQDGRCTAKKGFNLDNRWVVPYNPYLSTKYNAHINVEIATSVQSVKYLYKYVYKGHDRAMWTVRNERRGGQRDDQPRDEIQEFLDGRYIGCCEACWRILGFSTGEIWPPVTRLTLHLPGEEPTYVRAGDTLENLRARGAPITQLTAYFDYMRRHPDDRLAKTLRYIDFPEHFTWDPGAQEGPNRRKPAWKPRLTRQMSVGRIYNANITDIERYCLRMLLCNVRGATSFDDLKTVDGHVHPTFKDAARARGLLADDIEWDKALEEASLMETDVSKIRQVFAYILEFEVVVDPMALWLKHKRAMGEDFVRSAQRVHGVRPSETAADNLTLVELHKLLEHTGKTLQQYGLPAPDFGAAAEEHESRVLAQERAYDRAMQRDIVSTKTQQMNAEQRSAFDAVRKALDDVAEGRAPRGPSCFFLNGPAGTGKTFVYDALLASVRQHGRIALAMAASGIAAQLMPGGTTAHSRMKIPVDGLCATSMCSLRLDAPLPPAVRVILEADLLLVDEAPMMHKHCFAAVDRTLRDLTGVDSPFGGKVVVLGGDFRQCLPVVKHAQPAQSVDACLKRWAGWSSFKVLKLRTNVRVQRALALGGSNAEASAAYSKWLERVGDGTERTYAREGQEDSCAIHIPEQMVLPETTSMEGLIRAAYGDNAAAFATTDKRYLVSRTILAPRNVDVDEVNDAALRMFPLGADTPVSPAERTYYSADMVKEQEDDNDGANSSNLYPVEFLNTLNSGGLPKHKLDLKKGCIAMLLRNLNPREGLANGTRVVVLNMYNHLLEVQVVGGPHDGKVALIPRITNASSGGDLPFTLHRRQFPVKLAFAMTINKSQGQTLQNAVLYLPQPVFSHGQLYTAFSRVGDPSRIKALIKGGRRADGRVYTDNVVYRQVTTDNDVWAQRGTNDAPAEQPFLDGEGETATELYQQ